jgi:hypothetical protein
MRRRVIPYSEIDEAIFSDAAVVHPVLRALHQVARTPLLIRPEPRKVLGRRTTFPRAVGDAKTGLFVV